MSELSIQETLYPDLTCFGCGHANPAGLHLRSYRDGGRTTASFIPRPQDDNGFGFVNGGILITVLDCHTGAATLWEADHRGWTADVGAPLPFITAGFDVKFRRPTPLGPPLLLRAEPVEVSEAKIVIHAEAVIDETVRATMLATWLRFHPR